MPSASLSAKMPIDVWLRSTIVCSLGRKRPETERATHYARENASRAVPVLKKAKQEQQPYADVRMALFGCFQAVITEEIGALYETELMAQATAEIYDPATIKPEAFFAVMEGGARPNSTTKLIAFF